MYMYMYMASIYTKYNTYIVTLYYDVRLKASLPKGLPGFS